MQIEIEPQVLEWTREQFSSMVDTVKLKIFTQPEHCVFCNALMELAAKLAEISPKLQIESCSCDADHPVSKEFGVDKHPAIIIQGKEPYKVRWFGIPIGFEFSMLIQDIVTASIGETGLDEEVKTILRSIDRPVQLQVFTIPMCPKCPNMVRTAHDFAFFNRNITADVIDALEFRELAAKWHVLETPRTVINEKIEFAGVIGEKELAEMLLAQT
jgi:glutaredoxin-like protein